MGRELPCASPPIARQAAPVEQCVDSLTPRARGFGLAPIIRDMQKKKKTYVYEVHTHSVRTVFVHPGSFRLPTMTWPVPGPEACAAVTWPRNPFISFYLLFSFCFHPNYHFAPFFHFPPLASLRPPSETQADDGCASWRPFLRAHVQRQLRRRATSPPLSLHRHTGRRACVHGPDSLPARPPVRALGLCLSRSVPFRREKPSSSSPPEPYSQAMAPCRPVSSHADDPVLLATSQGLPLRFVTGAHVRGTPGRRRGMCPTPRSLLACLWLSFFFLLHCVR